MKKIFTILSIAFAIVLINSCGTAEKAVTNEPSYVADGRGESIDRDQAYDTAYHNAVTKITNKFNIVVNENSVQTYSNEQRSRGRATEKITNDRRTTTHSEADIYDVVVLKERMKRNPRGLWVCEIVIGVASENIE
jgi:hypothetical protein